MVLRAALYASAALNSELAVGWTSSSVDAAAGCPLACLRRSGLVQFLPAERRRLLRGMLRVGLDPASRVSPLLRADEGAGCSVAALVAVLLGQAGTLPGAPRWWEGVWLALHLC